MKSKYLQVSQASRPQFVTCREYRPRLLNRGTKTKFFEGSDIVRYKNQNVFLMTIAQTNASECKLELHKNHRLGKPTKCLGENKGADQLRGNREADQRLCFRYTDSTIPLLLKYKISCFCDCTGRFVLDLVGTQIVGFLALETGKFGFRK